MDLVAKGTVVASKYAPAESEKLDLSSSIKMNNGLYMPRLGLGTYDLYDEVCIKACVGAMEMGYRHFDTAKYYKNEREVGESTRRWKGDRKSLFITTKLRLPMHGGDNVRASVKDSLDTMGLDYLDLVLVHNPDGGGRALREHTWKEMEKLVQEGWIKSIGVSNYGVKHLEECQEYCTILPVTNQIELHPAFVETNVITKCNEMDIVVQAWSPLMRQKDTSEMEPLIKIADSRGLSIAQVALAWSLQLGFVPVPKSGSTERQKQNAVALSVRLSDAEMASLAKLNKGFDGSVDKQSLTQLAE